MKRLILILLLSLPSFAEAQDYSVAFWNVENLFDTYDDSLTLDDDFTPRGTNHWTYRRYSTKLNSIFKIIAALECPDIIGLSEVENDRVLRDLCQGTPLCKMGYRFIHFDSPEPRGLDCAIIYNPHSFKPYTSRPIRIEQFRTRDILQVEGTTLQGDTLILFVCHLPSQLGGAEAAKRRLQCAQRLRLAMDSAATLHPQALIIAMGDFNATPKEDPLTQGLQLPNPHYTNLMASLPLDQGSYCYHGHWSFIDQIILSTQGPFQALQSGAFRHPALLEEDRKHLTLKPYRAFLGPAFHGGTSDHLPVFAHLTRKSS